MSRVDLLVLGGGPAGATTAALAAAAGLRVTLIERARFPRDKVCGEFVSPEGRGVLGRLGLLPTLLGAGATSLLACRVTEPRGRRIDLDLPSLPGVGREALGISRARMDSVLLELAASRGVDVRERCEALRPVVEDGAVRGMHVRRVGDTGTGEPLPATLVVGADGRRSVLARALGLRADPLRSGRRSWFGLKAHLAGGTMPPRVELHLFDGGYAGMAPVEEERINFCMLLTVEALRSCGGSADEVLSRRVRGNPAACETLAAAKRCSAWQAIGPLRFGPRRAASHGALFVGDAAGTVDPFSGEGISHALVGAEIAAAHLLRAATRGGLSPRHARDYAADWRRAFGPAVRRSRVLGGLFKRPRVARQALRWIGRVPGDLGSRLVRATRSTASPARRST